MANNNVIHWYNLDYFYKMRLRGERNKLPMTETKLFTLIGRPALQHFKTLGVSHRELTLGHGLTGWVVQTTPAEYGYKANGFRPTWRVT